MHVPFDLLLLEYVPANDQGFIFISLVLDFRREFYERYDMSRNF